MYKRSFLCRDIYLGTDLVARDHLCVKAALAGHLLDDIDHQVTLCTRGEGKCRQTELDAVMRAGTSMASHQISERESTHLDEIACRLVNQNGTFVIRLIHHIPSDVDWLGAVFDPNCSMHVVEHRA